MIDLKDIYWAAGFMEGEGSFRFTKSKSGQVSAPQKQSECLERLQSMFGGSIYGPETTGRDIYQWQLNGDKAVGIMMMLFPLMSQKRKAQIKKSVDAWKTLPINPSKYIAIYGKCQRGHDWTPENIRIEVKDGKENRRCRLCDNLRKASRPKYNSEYYLLHKDKIKMNAKNWKLNHKKSTTMEVLN